jgi:hypothetical protein
MNGATVSVKANGERGEDGVAIAWADAFERFVDMLEAGLKRDAVARQQRHLRGAAGKPLQRPKAMLGGELADCIHAGVEIERRDTRSGLANFGNALPDL